MHFNGPGSPKIAPSHGSLDNSRPHLSHGSFSPKLHLDRFSRFCSAYERDQQTHRPRYRTPSVATTCRLLCTECLRCGRKCSPFVHGCGRLVENWQWSSETSYGAVSAVRENTGGNDTVSISLRPGRGMRRGVECCCSRWLFVELSVLKWSVRPRARTSDVIFIDAWSRLQFNYQSVWFKKAINYC